MPLSAPARTFRLHGLHIRVESDNPSVMALLQETLRYKGAVPDASAEVPDLTLAFLTEAPARSVPEEARSHGRSEHGAIAVWHHEGHMYLQCDDSVAHINPGERTAHATLGAALSRPSDARRDPLFYFVTFSLVILLRSLGRYALHTAALVHDGRGLLLVADSDSGKSTTALNLVRSGWQHVSDDTVLLRPGPDAIHADSFRRDFCLDPDAADLFPELAGHDWAASPSDATKWRVDLAQVYPNQFAATCVPHAIVLPGIEPVETSTLTPVARKTMLGHLMKQGALTLVPRAEAAQRHLDVLKRLVVQADTYRLRAGRDLIQDSDAASALLKTALASAPSQAPASQ